MNYQERQELINYLSQMEGKEITLTLTYIDARQNDEKVER